MITSHATGLAKGAVYAPPVPVKIVGSVKPFRHHQRTAGRYRGGVVEGGSGDRPRVAGPLKPGPLRRTRHTACARGVKTTSKNWNLSWTDTGIICIILILLAGFYANIYAHVEIITALERQEATAAEAAAVALTEDEWQQRLEELNATWERKLTDAEDAWGMAMGSGIRSSYQDGYSEGYWNGLSSSLEFNVTSSFPWITAYEFDYNNSSMMQRLNEIEQDLYHLQRAHKWLEEYALINRLSFNDFEERVIDLIIDLYSTINDLHNITAKSDE